MSGNIGASSRSLFADNFLFANNSVRNIAENLRGPFVRGDKERRSPGNCDETIANQQHQSTKTKSPSVTAASMALSRDWPALDLAT
ncbi:MAG: hypothetical protein JWQ87_2596 [Candidatus Sulfotelmatobacter sp.]|nr:hypothetical protein [Candidatus Sulfotelmatobacter sp.]